MKITVDIPDNEWALLVARAEAHDLKVRDLIRAAIDDVMPHRLPLRDHVLLLVKAGMSDKAVGMRLNLTNAQVARIRKTAGVPANPFRPEHRAQIINERKAS